jgi:CheY-like chemotaxis protein
MAQRILVVEDEEEVRDALREMLTAAGYEVDAAVDGYDAVEKAVSAEYDVITMDVRMPRLNGIGATDILRERRPSVPVVIISGFLGSEFKYRKDLEAMGVRYFLAKPFSLSDAVHTIRKAIEDHEAGAGGTATGGG